METSRRNLLIGGSSTLIVAPAIVRYGSIMPVKMFEEYVLAFSHRYHDDVLWSQSIYSMGNMAQDLKTLARIKHDFGLPPLSAYDLRPISEVITYDLRPISELEGSFK